jgi:hypothetical protein
MSGCLAAVAVVTCLYESAVTLPRTHVPFQKAGIPSFRTIPDTVVPIPAPVTCIRVLTVSWFVAEGEARAEEGSKQATEESKGQYLVRLMRNIGSRLRSRLTLVDGRME